MQSGELSRRKISYEPSLNKWITDANSWVTETQKWIAENMGQAAGEKFVDEGNTAMSTGVISSTRRTLTRATQSPASVEISRL